MLNNQLNLLQNMASELWKKATLTGKPSEVQQLTELALKCMADARDILRDKSRNSVLNYAECCIGAMKQPDYSHYLDFCARNSLPVMSQPDFEDCLRDLGFQGEFVMIK